MSRLRLTRTAKVPRPPLPPEDVRKRGPCPDAVTPDNFMCYAIFRPQRTGRRDSGAHRGRGGARRTLAGRPDRRRKQDAVIGSQPWAAEMRWHLIGHLQRNKVKFLDRFSLLHALDSARLADAVHEFGERRGRPVDALLQVNVAGEETKGGFEASDVQIEAERLRTLGGVHVTGVMTMAPFDANERELRRVFAGARAARDVLIKAGHPARELSMGMSGDYVLAVEEGATMVRLGTVLFGART